MKRWKCQFENLSDGKLCRECGYSLISAHDLRAQSDLSFDEKLAKILPYLPNSLTVKVLSQLARGEKGLLHFCFNVLLFAAVKNPREVVGRRSGD